MNDPQKAANNPDTKKLLYRLNRRLSEWFMWSRLFRWFWVYIWCHWGKYTEYPNFIRWRAGVFELCGSMACGFGFKHGWQLAMIYWRNK